MLESIYAILDIQNTTQASALTAPGTDICFFVKVGISLIDSSEY